jgi:hypothetical protein
MMGRVLWLCHDRDAEGSMINHNETRYLVHDSTRVHQNVTFHVNPFFSTLGRSPFNIRTSKALPLKHRENGGGWDIKDTNQNDYAAMVVHAYPMYMPKLYTFVLSLLPAPNIFVSFVHDPRKGSRPPMFHLCSFEQQRHITHRLVFPAVSVLC